MSDPHNSDLKQAIDRIERARQYTLELLDGIDPADWFRRPAEGVTHIAWQVGHLTMAQYALALMRVRDSQPGDRELMSRKFRRHFAKGSSPVAEPENNPSPSEILAVFHAIHRQVLKEIPELQEAELAAPLIQPHQMFETKLGALNFCADHEYLHAGQIGLLRRLLGKLPLR